MDIFYLQLGDAAAALARVVYVSLLSSRCEPSSSSSLSSRLNITSAGKTSPNRRIVKIHMTNAVVSAKQTSVDTQLFSDLLTSYISGAFLWRSCWYIHGVYMTHPPNAQAPVSRLFYEWYPPRCGQRCNCPDVCFWKRRVGRTTAKHWSGQPSVYGLC